MRGGKVYDEKKEGIGDRPQSIEKQRYEEMEQNQ